MAILCNVKSTVLSSFSGNFGDFNVSRLTKDPKSKAKKEDEEDVSEVRREEGGRRKEEESARAA